MLWDIRLHVYSSCDQCIVTYCVCKFSWKTALVCQGPACFQWPSHIYIFYTRFIQLIESQNGLRDHMIVWGNMPLQWRHNGRDGVSNHQPHDCLLNRLLRHRSKKTSKLRVAGLFGGNSPLTGESPHKGPVMRKRFSLMTSSCNIAV